MLVLRHVVHAMGDEKIMWSSPLLVCCTVQSGLHFSHLFNEVTTADTMMNPEATVPLRCPLLDTGNRTSKFKCLVGLVSPESAC